MGEYTYKLSCHTFLKSSPVVWQPHSDDKTLGSHRAQPRNKLTRELSLVFDRLRKHYHVIVNVTAKWKN